MSKNEITFQALPVGAYTDALSIAEWADAHTNRKDSTKLLPLDLYDRIIRWELWFPETLRATKHATTASYAFSMIGTQESS